MSLQLLVLHHFCGYCLGSHLPGLVAGLGAVMLSSMRRARLGIGFGLMACLIAIQCMRMAMQ